MQETDPVALVVALVAPRSTDAAWLLRVADGLRDEAALVGACDGDLSVGAILDAVAELLGADADQTRATYLPVVAELVADGFLMTVPTTR